MATPGKDKKLARDFSGSDSKQKRHQKSVQPEQEGQGFNHEDLRETVPIYSIAGCEKVIQGKNNQRIVLGRDRHGAVGEGGGYGHGHTHCGSIDIIVGPQAADVREKNKKGESDYILSYRGMYVWFNVKEFSELIDGFREVSDKLFKPKGDCYK